MKKSDIERALAPLAALTLFAQHNVSLPDPIFEGGVNVNGEGKTIRLTMEDAVRAQIALDYLTGLDKEPAPTPEPEPTPEPTTPTATAEATKVEDTVKADVHKKGRKHG